MGDFNMSLFRVVPELRKRGVTIDLGAWYPWTSLEGEPMSDSCGIFFVNLAGVYTLTKSLSDLHDDNATGILARGDEVGDSAVAEKVKDGGVPTTAETGEDFGDNEDEPPDRVGGVDSIEGKAGPGMRLETYLPKGKVGQTNSKPRSPKVIVWPTATPGLLESSSKKMPKGLFNYPPRVKASHN